jgi:succinoglycan biosynthesis transport protein ExoP
MNEPSALANVHGPLATYSPVIDGEFREMPARDLREQLWLLVRYRRIALISFGVTFGFVALFVILSPRLYTSSTKVIVSRQAPVQLRLEDSRVLSVGDIDSGTVRDNFNATQVAALQSRDLAERVIRVHRLAENPSFLKPYSVPNWVTTLLRRWHVLRRLGDQDLIDLYTLQYLSAQVVRGTDLLEVDFTTPDPSLSAFLAKAHIEAFLAMNAEARRATDTNANGLLAEQIHESEKRVNFAEKALRVFAAEHPNVAVNQEQNSIAQRVNEVSTLLTAAEAERATLQSQHDFLSKPGSDVLTYFLDHPGVQRLRLELLDLRAQVAGRDRRLGPEHPMMKDLEQQRKQLESDLQGEIKNELGAIQSKYKAAVVREERLRQQYSDLERSATALREVGGRYDALKNDLETARKLHASLLQQEMETTVNSRLVASNVRVIETPEVPEKASQPRLVLDLLLGILAGMVVAAGAVLGYGYFDSSVKSSAELEEFLQLPTLATIPNFALFGLATGNGAAKNGARASNALAELAVLQDPWSQIAEAFRTMKTSVLFSASAARTTPKVILVTSALAGEGKTFGSVNLAAALAEAGARVLLVDADMRHGRCHDVLGLPNDRGLSSVLAGQMKPSEVIHAVKMPHLFFLPAGPKPVNPAELIASGELGAALEDWRANFNFVVFDTPPALPVSDAIVIAQEVDGVVLVVRADQTARDLVRRVRDRLLRAGAPLLGVVLNSVNRDWDDMYYYYDGYLGDEGSPAEEQHA